MITVEEAKRILMTALPTERCTTTVPLVNASGRYVAESVVAAYDHPLFDCSAVDGYVLRVAEKDRPLVLSGSIPAGTTFQEGLPSGACIRIFTGAAVPAGADTVVMQERCRVIGDTVQVEDPGLSLGANIRRRGEQVRAGDVLLPKGSAIGPAAIGLLASVGTRTLHVAHSPSVTIVRTGDEFVDEGALVPGLIFSSNDVMLASALGQACPGMELRTTQAQDTKEALREALASALDRTEVVITTGGVSVGDHDLVAAVLEEMGATVLFHGVAQKPGKPMLFARWRDRVLFGLPGNPRAVMVLFWEYVLPFLRAWQGAAEPWLRKDILPLRGPLTVKGERAEFRAAHVQGGQVALLADEGSHMLRTLTEADALAYVPASARHLNAGDLVEVHFLPR
jgi:molybdopterin molybdotransferase